MISVFQLILSAYGTGFLALLWGMWILRQLDVIRFFELLVWPLTLLLATCRVVWKELLTYWEGRQAGFWR